MKPRATVLLLLLLVGIVVPGRAAEPDPTPLALGAPQWLTLDWLERQGSVRIAWNPVEGAFGYRILRGPAEWGNLEQVGSTKNLRWFDEKAAPGATYRYAIAAYAGETEGPLSEVRRFTVPGGEAPPPVAQEVPPPEWALAAGTLDTAGPAPVFRIHLVWLPPAVDGVVGYNVYRSGEPGIPGAFLGATPAMETRFVDQPQWEPGRSWHYTVRTIGPGFRQSEPTPERTVTLVARGAEGALRGRLSEREVALTVALLADADPAVRLLAAETLADAEPIPSVVSALAALLADTAADRETRLAAVTGLARVAGSLRRGEDAAVVVVAPIASAVADSDTELAARARGSLGRITGEDLGDDPAGWLDWFAHAPVEAVTPAEEAAPEVAPEVAPEP